MQRQKPEILAPVGDFEKLQMAIAYGADAVYLGGKQFSLRANSKNFDNMDLTKAIEYAHAHNVKVYVAVNIFAHNEDLYGLEEYLQELKDIRADAVIVSDMGVFDIARQIEGLEVHISTQANVTNFQSALMYKNLGASRIILARELTFEEVRKINEKVADETFKTEIFVHGAMCISYSGRCLLSSYMVGRDANKGDCAHPCRWSYSLVEELRPDEYFPVVETERGTYIMNSKDLCLVAHIPQLVESGVSSLKIEGRMKSAYYVAVTTKIYREALDDFFESEELYYSKIDYYDKELEKVSHRDFHTGFFVRSDGEAQKYSTNTTESTHEYSGLVVAYDEASGCAVVEQRNKYSVGDEVEFIKNKHFQVIREMYNEKGERVESSPHPQELIYIKVDKPVEKFDIMRKAVGR